MIIKLSEIEPYAIWDVDNQSARLFLSHLNGSETFEFYGQTRPKCMLLYDLNYKYPRLTSAHGFLLSITIDTVKSTIETNKGITWDEIIKKFKIGDIHIDLGGDLSYPKIYT